MDSKDSYPRPSSQVFDQSNKSSSESTETFLGFIESPPFVVTYLRPKSLFPLDRYIPDEEGSKEVLLQHERRFSDPQVPLVTENKSISSWKWILVFCGLSLGAFLAGKIQVFCYTVTSIHLQFSIDTTQDLMPP